MLSNICQTSVGFVSTPHQLVIIDRCIDDLIGEICLDYVFCVVCPVLFLEVSNVLTIGQGRSSNFVCFA